MSVWAIRTCAKRSLTRRRLPATWANRELSKIASLHSGHETETEVLADLADLTQKAEILHKSLVLAAPQVVEQFVHNEEQSVVGVAFVERRHHVLEGALVVGNRVPRREAKIHIPPGQRILQLGTDEAPEVHRYGAKFGTRDFEFARDLARGLSHSGTEYLEQCAAFRDRRDHRHEMRLARSIVSDDEQTLVVRRLIELELLDHDIRELIGHLVADYIGGHQPSCGRLLVGVPELDHRLDRVELDQVTVFHMRWRYWSRGRR